MAEDRGAAFYMLGTTSGILKLVNVVFVIISISVFFSAFNSLSTLFFIATTIVCGLFFLFFILLTYIIDGHHIQKTPYESMANSYLCLIFLAAAITCWSDYYLKNGSMITTGIFCLLSSILFGVDAFFSVKNANGGIINNLLPIIQRQPKPNPTAPAPDLSNIGQPVSGTNTARMEENISANYGKDDPAIVIPKEDKF